MAYLKKKDAIILLEDGTVFHGKMVGPEGTATGEICFNTGTTGYQEIFTDPSYYGQIMVTTNAHIGNYGATDLDLESNSVKISCLVCKNFSIDYSRPLASSSLAEFLQKQNLIFVSDVDTRALVAHIREHGAQNAIVSSKVNDREQLEKELNNIPSMKGLELASQVSTKKPYFYGNEDATYRIAALDLGIKTNILRNLASRDCYIQVFPYNSSFKELTAFQPHGYFISNGPGDPEPLIDAITLARKVLDHGAPLFGICLGHQVIALANNIKTYKMHNGHRGINHPIKNIQTGKGEITSQNHGFAIDRKDAEANANVEITHTHLNDQTVAGIRIKNKPCFSVQYHPEAGPGPNDATYLFDQFIQLIQSTKKEAI